MGKIDGRSLIGDFRNACDLLELSISGIIIFQENNMGIAEAIH